jgi:hypothetical protein
MGKAIKVVITQEQKQTLLKLRSSRAGKNIGERASYILLSSSGKSIGEISAQLGGKYMVLMDLLVLSN